MPLKQGEILHGCSELSFISAPILQDQTDAEVAPEAKRVMHKHVLLISPDCDLEQDFKARVASNPDCADCYRDNDERNRFKQMGDRNCMVNATLTPLWTVEEFKERSDNRTYGQVVKSNNHPKWCKIGPFECDSAVDPGGVFTRVIDCGYQFTLPMSLLHDAYAQNSIRFGWIPSPYREHYLQRFQNWQARIGVDDIL